MSQTLGNYPQEPLRNSLKNTKDLISKHPSLDFGYCTPLTLDNKPSHIR